MQKISIVFLDILVAAYYIKAVKNQIKGFKLYNFQLC